MYGNKQHVDKHVANILGRIKDAKERNSRGYQIAKLYVDVEEYEVAKRYLSGFLTVRDTFAPAHKLHGQILENLDQTDDAIAAYKRSLDLDERQKDVIVKVCELYLKDGKNADILKYWAERAEKHAPGSPVIFKLREKMVNLQNEGDTGEDLESLIAAELVKRPKDAELRAKLLRMYLDTGRVNEAYTHAVDVENKYAYPDSISWCHAVLEVFERYQRESGEINGSYHQNLLTIQSRLVELTLNQDKDRVVDAAEALYKFDQLLFTMASAPVSGPSWEILYREMQAQFYSYAGHLLLKRAQQGHLPWLEANNMAAYCYLISFSVSPPNMMSPWVVKATEEDKRRYNDWHGAACYRASEAGHLLQSLSEGEGVRWANKVHAQWAIGQGRDKIFDHMFTLRHMKGNKDSSFLMTNGLHMSFKVTMPSEASLRDLDKVAHLHHGEELRNLVWLALHKHEATDRIQPDYGFTVFRKLQYETTTLDSASPESLSRLDTEVFLHAVVHTTAQWLSERRRALQTSDTQIRLLPLCLREVLCTSEQAEWWKTVHILTNNLASKELGRLRLVLQRGIEAVRLIGNHGVPVALVVHLARVFAQRAEDAKTTASVVNAGLLKDRAFTYWTGAVDMLHRLENNQTLWSPKQRLFINQGPILSKEEIRAGLEEGQLFLAMHNMEMGNNETALEGFSQLTSAKASHSQAQIYLAMAEDADYNDDNTHEVALYTKARDALYLTLDRLQGQRHHNLTQQLPAEIDRVEARLNSLKSGAADIRPCYVDDTDAIGEPSDSIMRLASLSYNTSTPQRPTAHRPSPKINRPMNGELGFANLSHHSAPSPERLDAQVRSLSMSQDLIMKQLREMKDEMDNQKKLFQDELAKNTREIEKLKDKIEKLGEMKSSAAAVPAAPQPPPPQQIPPQTIPQIPAAIDRNFRPAVPAPPPAAAYYPPYRPEYDYPGPPPHPALTPYSPHPHGYPIYAPPFPAYPYAPAPPQPSTAPPPTHPQQPTQVIPTVQPARQSVAATGQDEEEDYYIYEDEEFPNDDEDAIPTLSGRGRDQVQPSMVPHAGTGGPFHIPDSQLVQDWPYGNSVNMEGKATLTYSPSHPIPQSGYFSQMPAPPRSQTMPAQGMYAAPLAPAPAIGPGFFSSPDRPAAFSQRFQSPTHLGMQAVPAVSQLTPPKPGFLPTNTAPKTETPRMAPPNASLTTSGAVISPGTPRTTSGPAVITGASIKDITPKPATPITTPTASLTDLASSTSSPFGTKFPISMPTGSSVEAKMPTLVPESSPFTLCSKQEDEEEDGEVGDDSYTGPDFEPIIPLPAEVEVVTGEEEETVLFSTRCKLFRFMDRQWKERGLGDIKILHHEDTGKVRVVMRREQVHKVCANFSLSPEMTVNYKSTAEKKVLTWSAMDFSEGQSHVEQFCAKFKNEDIAIEFKRKFEEGIKIVNEKKPVDVMKKTEVTKPTEGKSGLLDKFKPKAGSWTCDVCMINNKVEAKKCVACETPRPGVEQDPVENKNEGPKVTFGTGGGFSFGSGTSDFKFGSPSTGGVAPAAPKPGAGGFTFGSTSSTPVSAGKTTGAADSTPATSFSFGAAGTPSSGFKFGSTPTTTATVSSTSTPASSFKFGASTGSTLTPSGGFAFGSKPSSESLVSSTAEEDSAASKASAVISPPRFSFTSKTGSTKENDVSSTTTEPASKPFTFGGGSSITFGSAPKPAADTTSTPASDMLKSFASQAKPTDVPKPQATSTLGGFTFTSTPVVQKKEEPEPKEAPVKEDPKPSPFAGFSFAKATSTTDKPTQVFGSFGTKTPSFAAPAPGMTKTEAPAAGVFGSNVGTTELTFGSLVDDNDAKVEAFSQKSDFKGFPGAGAPVFKAGASPKKGQGHEEGEDEEEYEPNVDFQPVIPLPALVDVKTGEEDEIKLFSERVKLYRHDQETKQWKERGIGDMKILQHKETNQCRLLMRRDQVLKICCNQKITPEIKLQPMATSEKAWCWIGQDFSEGEVRVEQFACKFKNPEVALKFKNAFEDAQKIQVKEPEKAKAPAKVDGKQSLSSLFKPKEGSWKCDLCLVSNKPEATLCAACQTPKPPSSQEQTKPSSTATPSTKPKVTSTKTDGKESLSSMFKPKVGQWKCEVCLVSNAANASLCAACQTPKPGADPSTSTQSSEISSTTVAGSGFSGFQFGSGSSKYTFGSGKESDSTDGKGDTPASTFTFTGGFTFGKAPEASSASEPAEEKHHSFSFTPSRHSETRVSSSSGTGFVFGKEVPNTGFTFSGVSPSKPLDLSASKSPRSPAGDEFYVNEEGDDSHIYFEPVVHLEKVDVKTGEEEEDTAYSHRAKLYRFTNNEWKERGLGDVKILRHKETKRYRIIMRREQVHKLCLNHYITPELQLQPMNNANGKAWVWHAEDYVDCQVAHEQLAIKFKNKEIADEFKKAFDDARENKTISTPKKAEKTPEPSSALDKQSTPKYNLAESKAQPKNLFGSSSSTPSGPGSFTFKPLTGSVDSTPKSTGFTFGSGGSGTSFTFGKTGTPSTSVFGGSPTSSKEAEALAKASRSPASKEGSLLAKMLEDDDVIFVDEKQATPDQIKKARALKLPDHFYLYEDRPPCKGCLGCDDGEGKMIRKKEDVIYLGKESSSKEQIEKARVLQLPDHFYLYETKPPCPGCRGCESDQEVPTAPTTVSSTVTPASSKHTSQPDIVHSTLSSTDNPVFGSKSGEMSFSSLAATSGNGFTFGKKDSSKPFSWAGAGSSLFTSPGAAGAGGDEGEDGEVAPSADVHFEPLVNLPEVEVKTGEEDEDVLYSHRAKLFRFDNVLKQWKERGVGDMKLLKHRVTGKIRVLMRREQVLKLAANHMMTLEMQLTPLHTSETAWCWFALDIAEGTARHEHFAVKFKTREIAETFKLKFEECQELLRSLPVVSGGSPFRSASAEDSFVTVEGDRSYDQSHDQSGVTTGDSYCEDEEEDEEEEDGDEEEIFFNKRATLKCAVDDNKWETLAMGDLMIVYDDDVMGFSIRMFSDTNEGEYICNHIICREHQVLANETKRFCEWTAKDFATDEPVHRTFQAWFSSKAAVQDFKLNFNKGVTLAQENELSERTDGGMFLTSRELTVPEVVGKINED